MTTKGLLTRTATANRLAVRCLTVFDRLLPAVDEGQPEDLGSWEANFINGFPNDQFGAEMDVWDWANNEINWTI